MNKIFFPYSNQPKKFPLRIADPICFAFYADDFMYEWEIGASGMTLLLHNGKIVRSNPVKSNIFMGESGTALHLTGHISEAWKHTYIAFAKIGRVLHDITTLDPYPTSSLDAFTLDILDSFRFGMIDPLAHGIIDTLTLGELDAFTLGGMAGFADWMTLDVSKPKTSKDSYFIPVKNNSYLRYADNLAPTNTILIGGLTSRIAVTDLKNERYMTLGELDSKTLGNIDTRKSVFQIFDKIPAIIKNNEENGG